MEGFYFDDCIFETSEQYLLYSQMQKDWNNQQLLNQLNKEYEQY